MDINDLWISMNELCISINELWISINKGKILKRHPIDMPVQPSVTAYSVESIKRLHSQ